MSNAPQFLGSDLVYRTEYYLSTVQPSVFLQGKIDTTVVDVQVSIRGGAFESDPDLVYFENDYFIVPNPAVFSNGLSLVSGENNIKVRTIDIIGSISPISTAKVFLFKESQLGVLVEPPTRITMERKDSAVLIQVQGISNSAVKGYHFYGSLYQGGGSRGYQRLNRDLVNTGIKTTETRSLGVLEVRSEVVDNSGESVKLNIVGTQKDILDNTLQIDFDEYLTLEGIDKYQADIKISAVEEVTYYSFLHNRNGTVSSTPPTIPYGEFTSVSGDTPIYYVVSALFKDDKTGLEIESPFSEEIIGYPLNITTQIGNFPVVSQDTIRGEMMLSIFRTHPELNMNPSSVIRDVFIDPASREIQRVRFVLDFLHRASSFTTLLLIDDPTGSGDSIPVDQSSYKLALRQCFYFNKNSDVQDLIDQCFDKLASNFGVSRGTGTRAEGEVTFYTTVRPATTISIPLGTFVASGSVRFRTTAAAQIPLDNIANFYSPTTGRYSVKVPVVAEEADTSGNVGIGQINRIVEGGVSNVRVTNELETFGGKNLQTNRELAITAMAQLSSVDSGTFQGYRRAAINTPNVREVNLVVPNDDYMIRDYDPVTKKHYGGKVDIWIRGSKAGTVTDSFALQFKIVRDAQFEIFGYIEDYTFIVLDSSVTPEHPLIELLDFPEYGYGLFNGSTGEMFDLTNVSVLDYNKIKLWDQVPQPSVSLSDVIYGDFRFRESNAFTFTRQPVNYIKQIIDTTGAVLSSVNYTLVRRSTVLNEGRSVKAGDYLEIFSTAVMGEPIEVLSESHVLQGFYIEPLKALGINPITVKVFNEDRTVEYANDLFSDTPDYVVEQDNQILSIKRTQQSTIASGDTVLVDYYHDPNYQVTYVTDSLITLAQQHINNVKHLTADVLIKQGVPVSVDIEFVVKLQENQTPDILEPIIRTSLQNLINNKPFGVPLRVSEIIKTVSNTEGVSYLPLPIIKLVRSRNSLVVRESVDSKSYTEIPSWSTLTNLVYVLNTSLKNATVTGGGTSFKDVFLGDQQITLLSVGPETLGTISYSSFIIGSTGLSIPNYSDDATLISQGFITNTEITQERIRLTANKILLSLPVNSVPSEFNVFCTYSVGVDTGVKDIEIGPVEYLQLGSLNMIFEQDNF